uniref:Uncharacterized protein n=1 Tax=Arundo donax TaxID=35708 RepID=A0A0A8YUN5_ARUDO
MNNKLLVLPEMSYTLHDSLLTIQIGGTEIYCKL